MVSEEGYYVTNTARGKADNTLAENVNRNLFKAACALIRTRNVAALTHVAWHLINRMRERSPQASRTYSSPPARQEGGRAPAEESYEQDGLKTMLP